MKIHHFPFFILPMGKNPLSLLGNYSTTSFVKMYYNIPLEGGVWLTFNVEVYA